MTILLNVLKNYLYPLIILYEIANAIIQDKGISINPKHFSFFTVVTVKGNASGKAYVQHPAAKII